MCKKCRNRKTGTYYAVKILSRHKHDATNEVKYLNKCQGHENIVKLYDVLQDDLHTYIIMELLTGGELFDRIRQRVQFTEREAALIMKSLISAVQYVHSQGVVHRDLKPENIIFTDSTDTAKVKIVDFGFARLKPDQKQMRRAACEAANALSTHPTGHAHSKFMLQTPCFTLPYAAPEVLKQALHASAQTLGLLSGSAASGNQSTNSKSNGSSEPPAIALETPGAGYDESCDLWSLGVILYTMLCGCVPFSSSVESESDMCSSSSSSSSSDEGDSASTALKLPNSTTKRRQCVGLTLKNPTTNSNNQHQQLNNNGPGLVTQEKIIERIRNASSTLKFEGKRWQNVSESGKQLLRGLLNIDPSKRMKLRDLCRHVWIKTLGGGGGGGGGGTGTNRNANGAHPLLTTKILNKHFNKFESRADDLVVVADEPNAAEVVTQREAFQHGHRVQKFTLRSQFSQAFEAFHAAEEKGLFTLQLKEVFDGPLAQRRHQKRSTSSNASSESNMSATSICSSLSTSTTSVNTNVSGLYGSTPTKKCPSNCGKLSEPMLFTFNDAYVNEYLKQQQQQQQQQQHVYASQCGQNQVFNRPITRSITHYNNKLNTSGTAEQRGSTTTVVFDFNVPLSSSDSNFNIGGGGDESKSSQNDSVDSSCVTSCGTAATNTTNGGLSAGTTDAIINHNFCIPNIALYTNNIMASGSASDSSDPMTLGQPPSKRLKRCATILID